MSTITRFVARRELLRDGAGRFVFEHVGDFAARASAAGAPAGGSSPAPCTIHPSAIVDAGAQIGAGSRVWHFVHVCGGARIGERCSLGQNVFVGNRVVIGTTADRASASAMRYSTQENMKQKNAATPMPEAMSGMKIFTKNRPKL